MNDPMPRRRMLSLLAGLTVASLPARGETRFPIGGVSIFGRKKISKFGKIYDYLKDGFLRVKETGKQRITIESADFSGERFKGTSWGYFDFVDCDFVSSYDIELDWLTNCTFTNCHFQGTVGFGQAIDVRFLRCKATGKSGGTHLYSDWKSRNLVFEDCEFLNADSDPNHIGSAGSAGEATFISCNGKNFAWKGSRKLTLMKCTTRNGYLDTASPGLFSDISEMPHSDFLLEDCDFTRGVDMTNAELNNFTLRNCKPGFFETTSSIALGDVLVEGIKEGHVKLSASSFRGTLTVRNCSFFMPYKGYSFRCGGCVPVHTLLENLTCGFDPADVVSTYGPRKEWKDPPPNKTFLIRHCKIPHLQVDWAQTEHLRIEDCDFDFLDIRNGRIGKLEIIGCSFQKLDVSNTQVKTHDLRLPAGGGNAAVTAVTTVTTGSNIKLPRE